MFDEHKIFQVIDPENPQIRYELRLISDIIRQDVFIGKLCQ